jgi:hypothetical protein
MPARRYTPDEVLSALADGPYDQTYRVERGRPLTTDEVARLVRRHHGDPEFRGDGRGNADVRPALDVLAADGRLVTSRVHWATRGKDMPTDADNRDLTRGVTTNANERVWATPETAKAWRDRLAADARTRELAEVVVARLDAAFIPLTASGAAEVDVSRVGLRVQLILDAATAGWLADKLTGNTREG